MPCFRQETIRAVRRPQIFSVSHKNNRLLRRRWKTGSQMKIFYSLFFTPLLLTTDL
jgi:hypothetical protein